MDAILMNLDQVTRFRGGGTGLLLDLTIVSSSLARGFKVDVLSDPMGLDHCPIRVHEIVSDSSDMKTYWAQVNWQRVGLALDGVEYEVYEEMLDRWSKEISQVMIQCTDRIPVSGGTLPPGWGMVTRRLLALKRYYHRKALGWVYGAVGFMAQIQII